MPTTQMQILWSIALLKPGSQALQVRRDSLNRAIISLFALSAPRNDAAHPGSIYTDTVCQSAKQIKGSVSFFFSIKERIRYSRHVKGKSLASYVPGFVNPGLSKSDYQDILSWRERARLGTFKFTVRIRQTQQCYIYHTHHSFNWTLMHKIPHTQCFNTAKCV